MAIPDGSVPALLRFDAAPDLARLILRIGVAVPFLYHGLEKRKYWSMPPGRAGSGPMLGAYRFLSFAEPLGGAAVLLGVLTRFAALGLSLVMLGAIRTRIFVWHNSFGEDDGWEIDFILLSAAGALIFLGAGRWSLEGWWHLP